MLDLHIKYIIIAKDKGHVAYNQGSKYGVIAGPFENYIIA